MFLYSDNVLRQGFPKTALASKVRTTALVIVHTIYYYAHDGRVFGVLRQSFQTSFLIFGPFEIEHTSSMQQMSFLQFKLNI
jgi:hypothetical protein